MMVHDIGGIECVPSVIDKHFRFNDAFFDKLLDFSDFFNVPVMSVVKSVVVVMEVIGIKFFELLSALIRFIGFT
jgi:hypothetical protein